MEKENKKVQHKWTRDDQWIALFVYLQGVSKSKANQIANERGFENPSSLYECGRNFQYLATDGKEGRPKYSKATEQVWNAYKQMIDIVK